MLITKRMETVLRHGYIVIDLGLSERPKTNFVGMINLICSYCFGTTSANESIDFRLCNYLNVICVRSTTNACEVVDCRNTLPGDERDLHVFPSGCCL